MMTRQALHASPPLERENTRTSPLALTIELAPDQIESIALRVAALLADQGTTSSLPTWLDTRGAAEYLACTPGRVHDLVQLRKLEPRRDGRRLLFRRDELDGYLEAAA
jgi:excisionase family DNA binding protein